MSRTSRVRRLLALAGLAAIPLTMLGANPASAQEGPRQSGSSSEDVPVVDDPGLASSPTTDSAPNLLACYDGAEPWDVGTDDVDGDPRYIPGPDEDWDGMVGGRPVYVASDDCNDVNLRITSARAHTVDVRVCFYPYSASYYCGPPTSIAPDDVDWNVIATDLIDGTRFEVEFLNEVPYLSGDIAY
jgi:hypothetical protein